MTPVYQSIVSNTDGDCFRASTASLLDLSIEQVPHFIRFPNNKWFDIYIAFMRVMGYEYEGICNALSSRGIKRRDSIKGYFEATVPSVTFEGCTHSVIMDTKGVIVHDPNPNKAFLGKTKEEAGVLYWYMFSKIK